jgi:hypothetical protein
MPSSAPGTFPDVQAIVRDLLKTRPELADAYEPGPGGMGHSSAAAPVVSIGCARATNFGRRCQCGDGRSQQRVICRAFGPTLRYSGDRFELEFEQDGEVIDDDERAEAGCRR